MTMKHIIIIFSLFIGCASICAAPAYGEQESPFSNVNPSAQQAAGSSYSSTVYQPFSGTTPAEQSAGAMNSSWSGPAKNNARNFTMDDGFILGPDTPPANQFPVGEPWVLLVFAALAAGVIAYKRKKEPTQPKTKSLESH